VSLGSDGAPESRDSALRTDSKTSLRQEVIQFRAENQWLRQQLAAQQERIEELESELKRYKNAHTPSSKQGGADGSGENNSSDGDGEDADTDREESASGDAASDSSSGRDEGHEGTTRTPPEPEKTIHVNEGYCRDCDCVLTNPDDYVSQTVIDIPLPVPTTVVEYQLGRHECSCGNEIVAERPECPKTGRFGP